MTESVGDTDIKTASVAECTELAELLDGLPSSAWDAPSLCAGWRTREVVAHLTMPARYSTPRFMFELLKAHGNMHAWKPPGGGYDGALTHTVIHGLDFTVVLGLGR